MYSREWNTSVRSYVVPSMLIQLVAFSVAFCRRCMSALVTIEKLFGPLGTTKLEATCVLALAAADSRDGSMFPPWAAVITMDDSLVQVITCHSLVITS